MISRLFLRDSIPNLHVQKLGAFNSEKHLVAKVLEILRGTRKAHSLSCKQRLTQIGCIFCMHSSPLTDCGQSNMAHCREKSTSVWWCTCLVKRATQTPGMHLMDSYSASNVAGKFFTLDSLEEKNQHVSTLLGKSMVDFLQDSQQGEDIVKKHLLHLFLVRLSLQRHSETPDDVLETVCRLQQSSTLLSMLKEMVVAWLKTQEDDIEESGIHVLALPEFPAKAWQTEVACKRLALHRSPSIEEALLDFVESTFRDGLAKVLFFIQEQMALGAFLSDSSKLSCGTTLQQLAESLVSKQSICNLSELPLPERAPQQNGPPPAMPATVSIFCVIPLTHQQFDGHFQGPTKGCWRG